MERRQPSQASCAVGVWMKVANHGEGLAETSCTGNSTHKNVDSESCSVGQDIQTTVANGGRNVLP